MRNENVLFLVQARLQATRLPGKVLLKLGYKTLLENVVFGLPPARTLILIPKGEIVLRDAAQDLGYTVVEGPEKDVMKRYELALHGREETVLARITADNPCWLRTAVDEVLDVLMRSEADYAAPAGLPLGVGFELFTRESFLHMCQSKRTPEMIEHVTAAYHLQAEHFKRAILQLPDWEGLKSLRLTIDTPEDLQMMQTLAKRAATEPCKLLRTDFVRLLKEHPSVFDINAGVTQKSMHDVET